MEILTQDKTLSEFFAFIRTYTQAHSVDNGSVEFLFVRKIYKPLFERLTNILFLSFCSQFSEDRLSWRVDLDALPELLYNFNPLSINKISDYEKFIKV